MTHYNNWSEIPEELQDTINAKLASWTGVPKKLVADWYAEHLRFQWAIDYGLINKPEPVEGWFVPKSSTHNSIARAYDYGFMRQAAITLFKNPDGTYSEVKADD